MTTELNITRGEKLKKYQKTSIIRRLKITS